MQRADLITGIMTAGLSLWLLFYAIPVHTGEGMGYGLSPAGLPKIMAMSLFCLALIQIGNSLIQSIKRRSAGGEEKETGIGFSHGLFWIKLILLFAISLIGMNYIGFIVGATFFMAVFQYLSGQRNYLVLSLLAIGTPVILRLAFWYGMGILLPQGVWY